MLTLIRGPINEVAMATQVNHAFTIGTWDSQTIETARERTEQRRAYAALMHVQMQAEAHFDRLDETDYMKLKQSTKALEIVAECLLYP